MSIGTRLIERLETEPKVFQIQGVRFLEKNNGRAILADDMGLGKTYQTIAWIALHPEIRPIVIVCPATLKYNWQREFKKHAKLKAEVLEGTTPYATTRDILILNYEIVLAWESYLKKLKPRLIVLDECHYISNRAAKRTKACVRIARKCRHVIPLSGTPIENGPLGFWPILHMTQPRVFESFHEFAWKFCDPKQGYRGWDYRGSSNGKLLHRLVRPFMLRRMKFQVLKELPKKRRILLPVEITNRKEYVRARDDFVEWLETKEGIKAVQSAKGALALVRMGKLKQVAALGKIKAIVQCIKDFLATGEKLVVFAIHREVIGQLVKKFPGAAVITGSTPLKKRQKAVDRFQQNQRCRLFIGQLRAAGQGITLTAANRTLTVEFGWNEAKHNQAEDRVNRIGQKAKTPTENYYMVARNTIEEWLLEIIHEKQVGIDQVLEGKVQERMSLLKMLERF